MLVRGIRWDINSLEQLPNYNMKTCFLALYNFVNEIVHPIFEKQSIDVLPYRKRAVKLASMEMRRYHSGYLPNGGRVLEHCNVDNSTTCYNSLIAHFLSKSNEKRID